MAILDELTELIDKRIADVLPSMVEDAIRQQIARILGSALTGAAREPEARARKSEQLPLPEEAPKEKKGSNKNRSVIPAPEDELSARGNAIYRLDKMDPDKKRQAQKHIVDVIAAQPDGELRGLGAAVKTGFSQGYFRYMITKLIEAKVVKVRGERINAVYTLDKKQTDKWLSKNSEPPKAGFEDVTGVDLTD